MAGLFEAISTEEPNYLSSSEQNAQRAEAAANSALNAEDEAKANAAASRDYMLKAAGAVTGVGLFNERFGAVYPMKGDYTADMVGARSDTWVPTWAQVTNKPDVITVVDAQTITGLKKVRGTVDADRKGIMFGTNDSSISFNNTTGGVEIQHGSSKAVLGLQADGVIYAVPAGTTTKYRYYTEAAPFPLSTYYKLSAVNAAATVTIAPKSASVFNVTLNQTKTNINLSAYTETETAARQLTILITQGVGSQTVNWDSKIKWSQGRQPTLSFTKGHIDVVTLLTVDNGTTWLGMFNGGWF